MSRENGKYIPRLKKHYLEHVVPALMKRFKYKNPLEVPKIEKIVVNTGIGEAARDPKLLEYVMNDIALITGQWPIVRKARKSISNFKIRKGMPVGVKVTLRRDRMYEFLDRLITAAIPRIRDFRGLNPNSFDGRGNYTFGVQEQLIFPEIEYDKVKHVFGMDITIVTTAKTDEEARALLEEMGLPFRRR
ncbi:50S ribosomal protein L5 [bacterium]|nr:MAG: 50S ribosomal protein L5 [bacterium]